MFTENGYIETLDKKEAAKWDNYEMITEEVPDDNG